MKRFIVACVTGLALILSTSAANAQILFSVAADLPVSYSFDSSATVDDLSGIKIGVSLPFLPPLAYEKYSLSTFVSNVKTDVDVTMIDIFWELPIPIISITLGAGIGSASLTQTAVTNTFDDASLFQGFFSLGIPFFPFLDIHVGYHFLRGSATVASGSPITGPSAGDKFVMDGTMISIGIKLGF